MSNQVKLTLRPPPNVEFVDGYPGIPPGPNRPQASVKGSIELRTGPAGVKAKWVRIELRKIEVLPGAGEHSDFVGPSPVTLWQSRPGDEYGLLGSQDFSFTIRIPESIPPSVNLENRAGIRYELVASVCTKGKKGFFRKRKSIVVSTVNPIIIDKHELHCTWPVYNQPEARHLTQDGVSLNVERSSTCYGPGDKIIVYATVKSENMSTTVILRGFEVTLKESSIFRPGPYSAAGKKAAPQVRVAAISDERFPVNATLYGGNSHAAELSCSINSSHTTTTLNTARHIDVTYVLCVKALMGNGTQITMDLPLVVSNWQRNVSYEALRRIGPVPSLSLTSTQQTNPNQPQINSPQQQAAQTFAGRTDNSYANLPESSRYGTAPTPSAGNTPNEFGAYTPTPNSASRSGSGSRPGTADSYSNNTRTRATSNAANRLTIVNDIDGDINPAPAEFASGSGSSSRNNNNTNNYLSAEDEKKRLYERAKADVERVQGPQRNVTPEIPMPSPSPIPQPGGLSPPPASARSKPTTPQQPKNKWLTAEEEKARLYNEAQAAVQRTQMGTRTPSPPDNRINGSSGSTPSTLVATQKKPKTYLTAEEEKAQLKRYQEAKQAVDRTQSGAAEPEPVAKSTPAPNPVAYESLYPSQGATERPPPFPGTGGPNRGGAGGSSALSEKERLKKAYETQDAQAAAALIREQQARKVSGPNRAASSDEPPPFDAAGGASNPGVGGFSSAALEKDQLKKKFEAQDRVVASPAPPPRKASSGSIRSPQPHQMIAGPTKILSAVEEKALLAAKYAGDSNGAKSPPQPPPARTPSPGARAALSNGMSKPNGMSSPPPTGAMPSSPPPLKPRPPKEYIEETKEEDARVSQYVKSGTLPPDFDVDGAPLLPKTEPFTPFSSKFTSGNGVVPTPPPLPGKE